MDISDSMLKLLVHGKSCTHFIKDFIVRILPFIFLVYAVLAVRQLRDITEAAVGSDNAEDHAVGIRRKRGWVKELIDAGPRLVKGTGKVINWWQVRKAKRILLQDATLQRYVTSSIKVYSKEGGLRKAYKDFYRAVPEYTSSGTVREGRIGMNDVVILNEQNQYCKPTPCQTIELFIPNSKRDGWNIVIVLYHKVDVLSSSYKE